MHYTIKQVSQKVNVSVYTLRYYDKIGLLPMLKRDENGIRLYSEDDICWIELICCLKNSSMPLKDIKKFMESCMRGEDGVDEKRQILEQHSEHIVNQIENLECSLQVIKHKLKHINELGLHQADNKECL